VGGDRLARRPDTEDPTRLARMVAVEHYGPS
jgi:hypothetical protein